MPEMAAAVSKLMRNQDLIAVARKCSVVTRFRDTIGLPGRLSVRLQPNHPTDDPKGIAISTLDGLMYGAGDAVIGINPASDDVQALIRLWHALDEVRARFDIPTQTCVLTHVTSQLAAIERGAPIDLVFQSIAGTEKANASFGITLAMLGEACEAARSLQRATVGEPSTANVMYFETGQGSALSANAHHGVDQQTCEARAYAVARAFEPLLTNSVVGFIGPEYLYDGKQIIRAGLEDHFCGKLLGVPIGCDVCYTNHAEADSDDMDTLLTLLGDRRRDVHHGRARRRRRDARLPEHVVPRRAVPAVAARPQARAGVRGVARDDGARRRVGPARRAAGRASAARRLLAALGGMNDVAARDAIRGTRCATRRPRASRSDAPAPRCRRGRCSRSSSTMRGRATPCTARSTSTPSTRLLRSTGLATLRVRSAAPDRATYLLRPDLGRRLDDDSRARLATCADAVAPGPVDVAIVVADGLSALGVQSHAGALVAALLPKLDGLSIGPIAIAEQARVALGDEVGERLGARLVVVVIGERPGLTSPDSIGCYVTFEPKVGRHDAERNCISNVRPAGLAPELAAARLAWLIRASLRLALSGVALKDDSALLDVDATAPSPPRGEPAPER